MKLRRGVAAFVASVMLFGCLSGCKSIERDKKSDKLTSIRNAEVDMIDPQVYTGEPIFVMPVVEFDGEELIYDQDYTLSYENNLYQGEATCLINGIGDFTGVKEVPFQIFFSDAICDSPSNQGAVMFVENCFMLLLGRPATYADVTTNVPVLVSRDITAEEFTHMIVNTDEFFTSGIDNASAAANMYTILYGREATADERAEINTFIASGSTLPEIISYILSNEAAIYACEQMAISAIKLDYTYDELVAIVTDSTPDEMKGSPLYYDFNGDGYNELIAEFGYYSNNMWNRYLVYCNGRNMYRFADRAMDTLYSTNLIPMTNSDGVALGVSSDWNSSAFGGAYYTSEIYKVTPIGAFPLFMGDFCSIHSPSTNTIGITYHDSVKYVIGSGANSEGMLRYQNGAYYPDNVETSLSGFVYENLAINTFFHEFVQLPSEYSSASSTTASSVLPIERIDRNSNGRPEYRIGDLVISDQFNLYYTETCYYYERYYYIDNNSSILHQIYQSQYGLISGEVINDIYADYVETPEDAYFYSQYFDDFYVYQINNRSCTYSEFISWQNSLISLNAGSYTTSGWHDGICPLLCYSTDEVKAEFLNNPGCSVESSADTNGDGLTDYVISVSLSNFNYNFVDTDPSANAFTGSYRVNITSAPNGCFVVFN